MTANSGQTPQNFENQMQVMSGGPRSSQTRHHAEKPLK
jgi:hypothetical protein